MSAGLEVLCQHLSSYLAPAQIALVRDAYTFAERAHGQQMRRDGTPYITHPLAVAEILSAMHMDHQSLMAAMLHDVIEDCGVTKQDLIKEGFSVMTAEIVDELSKKPGETYFDFIMRIHDGGPFRTGMVAVKLADLQHNMSDLNEGSLKDKYRFAEYILNYFNP